MYTFRSHEATKSRVEVGANRMAEMASEGGSESSNCAAQQSVMAFPHANTRFGFTSRHCEAEDSLNIECYLVIILSGPPNPHRSSKAVRQKIEATIFTQTQH